MASHKGPPPAALHPYVVNKLLDLLSTDDDFRNLFQQDAHAALVQAGYASPAGVTPAEASAASGGDCLQMKAGEQLASKAAIAQHRAKLEKSLSMIQGFSAPGELKVD